MTAQFAVALSVRIESVPTNRNIYIKSVPDGTTSSNSCRHLNMCIFFSHDKCRENSYLGPFSSLTSWKVSLILPEEHTI